MQIVHSLNELERIPHSRLKLSSYLHSHQKSQFTKKIKNIHIFFYFHHFICRSLLLGMWCGGYWIIIMKMWPPGGLHSSPTSQNLSPTLFTQFLITFACFLLTMSFIDQTKGVKELVKRKAAKASREDKNLRKSRNVQLQRKVSPFDMIISFTNT